MIGFVIGALLGGTVGVTTMCICSVAGQSDRELEEEELERKRRQYKEFQTK